MEQTTIKHSEGTILAAKARDEYIEKASTTVKCQKCNIILILKEVKPNEK